MFWDSFFLCGMDTQETNSVQEIDRDIIRLSRIGERKIKECKDSILNLRKITLGYTPPSLCLLTRLETLDLSFNKIRNRFSEDMTNLVNLKTLGIRSCKMKSIPSPLTRMISLTDLDIGRNDIGKTYSELRNLTNLQVLSLKACGLREYENMETLVKMERLNLSLNWFHDNILNIENYTNLKSLDLETCHLSSFVNSKTLSFVLEELYLANNKLTSINSLSNLGELKKLDVSKNPLKNDNSIGKLKFLKELQIDFKWDTIDESMVEMKDLKKLSINGPLGILNPTLFRFSNLTEISVQIPIVFSKNELIGCTILKLSSEPFDIRDLFPYLSEEMVQNIRFKEKVSFFPDLSELKALSKVCYESCNRQSNLYFKKQQKKWLWGWGSKYQHLKPFRNNFVPLTEFTEYVVGKNGIVVSLPHCLLKYAQPSKIDTVEIMDIVHLSGKVYVLDTSHKLWKAHTKVSNSLELMECEDYFSNIYGKNEYEHTVSIITGVIMKKEYKKDTFPMDLHDIVKLDRLDSHVVYINSDGILIEVQNVFDRNPKISIFADLPYIVDVMIFSYYINMRDRRGTIVCIDEFGKLWIRKDTEEWKLIELPYTFCKIFHSYQFLLVTDDGKILQFDKSISNQFSSRDLPVLPVVYYNKQATKKSARN